MHDADDLPPEAFPWREMTRIQRHRWWWGPSRKKGFVEGDRSGGQEAFIDLYNRLAAEYGTAVTDGMIEGSIPPSDFLAMESRLRDDLDLWCEATGESRSLFLREAERLRAGMLVVGRRPKDDRHASHAR